MRVLHWLWRIVLFLLLFLFAAKNTAPVSIGFFLNYQWQVPLVVALLAFFVLGALLGGLALSGLIFRLRRDLARSRAELAAARAIPAVAEVPVAGEAVSQ